MKGDGTMNEKLEKIIECVRDAVYINLVGISNEDLHMPKAQEEQTIADVQDIVEEAIKEAWNISHE